MNIVSIISIKKRAVKFSLPAFGFLLLASFFLCGCETVSHQAGDGYGKTNLKELCDQYGIVWQFDSVSQVVTLRSGSREAKSLIDSNVVVIDGEKIHLGGPLKRSRKIISVPYDFESKVIIALTTGDQGRGAVTVGRRSYKIIVDPGHGGKDPGATGRTGLLEKTVVLDIANRLKKELRRKGFDVLMTRENDTFISLAERTEIASRSKADLFVSIHANSNPSRAIHGLEVYSLRDLNREERTEDQRKRNHEIMFNSLEMKKNDLTVEKIVSDMLYSYKKESTPTLASYVTEGTLRSTKAKNRGIKTAGFFVVRNTLIPSVLVEVGYLTNTREEKLLQTAEYRENVANGLADSIQKYMTR